MDSLNNKPTGITNFLDMMDKLSEKKNKLEQEYMTVDDNLKAQFELIPPFNHKLIPLVTNLVNAAETNNEKLSIIQDTKKFVNYASFQEWINPDVQLTLTIS